MMRARLYVAGSLLVFIAGCSDPSSEQVTQYSKECVRFYKEKRAASGEHVEYRTHWMKDGRLVISLAVKKKESDRSYTEGLCVVDFKDGTIQLPGLFNQDRWER